MVRSAQRTLLRKGPFPTRKGFSRAALGWFSQSTDGSWDGGGMNAHGGTQTYEMKTRSATTVRDGSTQMARPDLLLDDSRDRPMAAGRYLTSDEHHLLRLKKSIVIQRYARGWFARRRARQLRATRDERQRFVAAEAARRQHEAEQRRRYEIERRMRPRTTADFEILYNELEAWRLQVSETDASVHASANVARRTVVSGVGYSPEDHGVVRRTLK
jgi:hypothetical protein